MIVAPPRPAAFAALAATRPAPAGAAFLRAGAHARRLLLLKALLVRVRRRRAEVAPETLRGFEAAWRLLERTERVAPAVVRAVLDYPITGSWLAIALTEPAGPDLDRHLTRFELVAVTAALRAGQPLDLVVQAPTGVLSFPGVGSAHVAPGPVHVTSRSRVVRLHTGSAPPVLVRPTGSGAGPGWHGLRPLPGGTTRLEDLDPYRVPPGGVGSPARIAAERSDTDHAAWAGRWRAGRALLRVTDPARGAEVERTVGALVPLVPQGPRALGATLAAAPGAVLMTPSADAADMAETLVHELHHSKLSTLHELVPLYRPDEDGVRSTLYRVGWRPDERPVAGVFQGAYAHLALADLWRRAADARGVPRAWSERSAQQFDHVHDQVGEALTTLLESDELTNEGREFARRMRQIHASLSTGHGVRG
ncbi:HEXXH motif domain-containing protein [Streptomyces sp. NPDC056269]|uniref:HEXXH motif domain-containing protein n=1 Tax=Streptomyces sp. NPDC056269 TaxID=3345768 RepID=UPI0035DD7157